jgi:hypothetical protein
MFKKLIGILTIVSAISIQTQALNISPGTELLSRNDPNNTAAIIAWINDNTSYTLGTSPYKSEADGGVEEGSFESDYSTTFNGDLTGGTIEWDGPNYISDAAYLLVKDGNHEPAWYLFSLSGWDGQETINLSGFWPGSEGGAISDLAMFSGGTSVPDGGATAALLGLGVLGLAAIRRKK